MNMSLIAYSLFLARRTHVTCSKSMLAVLDYDDIFSGCMDY